MYLKEIGSPPWKKGSLGEAGRSPASVTPWWATWPADPSRIILLPTYRRAKGRPEGSWPRTSVAIVTVPYGQEAPMVFKIISWAVSKVLGLPSWENYPCSRLSAGRKSQTDGWTISCLLWPPRNHIPASQTTAPLRGELYFALYPPAGNQGSMSAPHLPPSSCSPLPNSSLQL